MLSRSPDTKWVSLTALPTLGRPPRANPRHRPHKDRHCLLGGCDARPTVSSRRLRCPPRVSPGPAPSQAPASKSQPGHTLEQWLSTEGRLPPGTGDDVWGHSIVTAWRCMQPASSGSRPKMLLRCRPPHRRGWRGTRSAVPKTRGPVPGRALRGDRASSCHALTGHAPGERGCSRSACTRGRPAWGSRSALQEGSCRTDSETCTDRRGGSPPSHRLCVWRGAGPGSVLGRFQVEVTQAVFSHGDISSRPPGLSPLQGL